MKKSDKVNVLKEQIGLFTNANLDAKSCTNAAAKWHVARAFKFGICLSFVSCLFIVANMDAEAAPSRNKAVVRKTKAPLNPAHQYLAPGVWRVGDCARLENFQAFDFRAPAKVEVGAGIIGQGERLDILSTARRQDIIEVRTKVCAPVGCNQTFEQYKIIGPNQMQEWRFEGLLPNEAPNIVVQNGIASDGTVGRTFNRCPR